MVMRLWMVGLLMTGIANAQDSTVAEGPRAERLRQLIEERFGERLTVELGLTADQSAKVKGVLATWGDKRRTMERDERSLRQQLQATMRPGVAADEKVVTRLTDQILAARIAYVQTFKDEMVDLSSVLTPIQRGQYVLLRDRLRQRVEEIRNLRQEGQATGRRPGRLRPR